ncbi:helix-turn-helix domain-containing protein [Flavobacterium kingsejongi]|uniref:Helix-turn-helix domain-containing protein n=1 Tax=Flavobacterium kingsejongi TaxID=1678728 RepID=A0A2S1LTG1_9FLAO|nr:helix-turn-helix domain-containing protein [Flavobacterium kingsejongi]AWG26988.1 hypothetical protein FK004_17985 [Flavobacterium kingsejongi]
MRIETVKFEIDATACHHIADPVQSPYKKVLVVPIITTPDAAIYSKAKIEKAQQRYAIIKPLLGDRGNLSAIKKIALKRGISIATLYRWLKIYDTYGTAIALLGKVRTGGKGTSRLTPEQDSVIDAVISKIVPQDTKIIIKKIIERIQSEFAIQNITPPHPNTIRNRINAFYKNRLQESQKIIGT